MKNKDKLEFIMNYYGEHGGYYEVYENIDKEILILVDYDYFNIYCFNNTIALYNQILNEFKYVQSVNDDYKNYILSDCNLLESEDGTPYRKLYKSILEIYNQGV